MTLDKEQLTTPKSWSDHLEPIYIQLVSKSSIIVHMVMSILPFGYWPSQLVHTIGNLCHKLLVHTHLTTLRESQSRRSNLWMLGFQLI